MVDVKISFSLHMRSVENSPDLENCVWYGAHYVAMTHDVGDMPHLSPPGKTYGDHQPLGHSIMMYSMFERGRGTGFERILRVTTARSRELLPTFYLDQKHAIYMRSALRRKS